MGETATLITLGSEDKSLTSTYRSLHIRKDFIKEKKTLQGDNYLLAPSRIKSINVLHL